MADAADSVLRSVKSGSVAAYDGAREALRLALAARRWRRAPWSRREDDGQCVSDERDLDVWERDLRRPLLTSMITWWERRDDRRDDVEREIRAFAGSWVEEGGEAAILADWDRWRVWFDDEAHPFGDAGTAQVPEPTLRLENAVDLRDVSQVGVGRLDLHYAELDSLDGIERFSELRTVVLYSVRGLTSVRPLERLPQLRFLRVVTDELHLANAVSDLDFACFPELRQLWLGCHVDQTLELDTAWVRAAPALRELRLGAFVPSSGSYAELAAADGLSHLEITMLADSDADDLRCALPHTALELVDPIEARNPGGRYAFDLIWEMDCEPPRFLMSPELADLWGVYNEHEAQEHLEALLEEQAPDLFRSVELDSEAGSQSISSESRYELERVLKLAFSARSVKLERHLRTAIEDIRFDRSRRIGEYDMWERRDVRAISVRVGSAPQDPRRVSFTVAVNDDEEVTTVGDPDSDPEGAQMIQAWHAERGSSDDVPAHDKALDALDASHRLAIRVVRAIRRYDSHFPLILVDDIDPWTTTN